MNNFLKGFLWVCALVHFVTASFPFGPPNQQGLANLLFGSKDPQVAFACFGDYIAKLNTSGVEYKQNYTNCLQEAKESRQRVEKEMHINRETLAKTAREICAGWERCNRNNATLDVFLCHAKEGPATTKDAFTISDRAEEFAKVQSGQYREIESNQESCCKSAERKYAAECAELYQKLKECLKGRTRPPITKVEDTTQEVTSIKETGSV